MLDALADGEDVGILAGAQPVIHHDAAVDLEIHGAGEIDIRSDADGDDDEIGLDLPPIGQLHARRAVGAGDLLGLAVGEEGDAALVEVALQQHAGMGVELALHQRRHQMHQGDAHAAALQAPGGLEAEQPAADDHRPLVVARRLQHQLDIVDVPERAGAGQAEAGDRRRQRLGAGGDEQLVVAERHAGGGGDRLQRPVHRHRGVAGDQADAVLGIPVAAVDDDLLERLLAGQHRGEGDAVVIRVRLGAEDGDVVALRRALQQLLDRPHAGHAVADDDEALTLGGDHVHGERLRAGVRCGRWWRRRRPRWCASGASRR
jgi:hypothetical protein